MGERMLSFEKQDMQKYVIAKYHGTCGNSRELSMAVGGPIFRRESRRQKLATNNSMINEEF
jgi:hypothetical protein